MICKATRRAALGALLLAALPGHASAGVVKLGGGQPAAHHAPSLQIGKSACSLHALCFPQNKWIPAHTKQIQHQVWIPAKKTQVWIAPIFEQHCSIFGLTYQVHVAGGYYTTQTQPRRPQLVLKSVTVPGYWEQSCHAIAAPPFAKQHTAPPASIFGPLSKKGSSFKGYAPAGYAGYGKKHKAKGYGG